MGHAIRDKRGRMKCRQCRNVGVSSPCVENLGQRAVPPNYVGRKSFTYFPPLVSAEEDAIDDADDWYVTSATEHMTGRREWFTTFQEIPLGQWPVYEIDGSYHWVQGRGNIKMEQKLNGNWEVGVLTNVLYVPALETNLYSQDEAEADGWVSTIFGSDRCVLTFQGGKKLDGVRQRGLYKLNLRVLPKRSFLVFVQVYSPGEEVIDDADDWYISTNTSEHMTGRRGWFSSFEEIPEGRWAVDQVIGGSSMWVRGRGNINVMQKLDGNWEAGVLENVLFVPDLKKNIYSMREAIDHGDLVSSGFGANGMEHRFENGKTLGGRQQGGLYVLDITSVSPA